jgi:hypothetical protein
VTHPDRAYVLRDLTIRGMGHASYRAYLRSDLWRAIRRRAFKLHGWRCKACARKTRTLHHLSYSKATMRGDDLTLLVPLCRSCHYKVEFDRKGRKRGMEGALSAYNRLLRMARLPKVKKKR